MPNEPKENKVRTAFGADRVYGVLGVAMVLAALVLWMVGGPRDGEVDPSASTQPPPVLVAEGVGPEGLIFRTADELAPGAAGWAIPPYHLHIEVDGREFMPAATQVERLGAGRFRWRVPALSPGNHTVRLFWSGPDHLPLQEGASDPLRFQAP